MAYASTCNVQTIPLLDPFAEMLGVDPGKSKGVLDYETGSGESRPFVSWNAVKTSLLLQPW